MKTGARTMTSAIGSRHRALAAAAQALVSMARGVGQAGIIWWAAGHESWHSSTPLCRLLLAVASTSLLADRAHSQEDRLLSESFTRSIGLQWKQDGRVIDVTLTNPKDKWLITEGKFVVEYPAVASEAPASSPSRSARSKPAPKPGGRLTMDDLIAQGYKYVGEPPIYTLNLHVLPGRTATVHIELRDSTPASGLKLEEARGREPSMLEKLKSAVR
jgi:hypothetical protein